MHELLPGIGVSASTSINNYLKEMERNKETPGCPTLTPPGLSSPPTTSSGPTSYPDNAPPTPHTPTPPPNPKGGGRLSPSRPKN